MEILTTIFNVLLIVLGFGLLIFIHELGHFVAAKWAGIRTEAFAVGMGPVALAWRKGIGLRLRSTARDYERIVRRHLEAEGKQVVAKSNDDENNESPQAEMYRIGDKLGLGETEYSLRWLPIGGFVKMLGQEDANPNYVSNDPRSYNRCSIGKRMIVVSAGVIMNLLLAIVLFIVAFMAGVRFDAPIVGEVAEDLAAGSTIATNAQQLGITDAGLKPADVVLTIDGNPARTFADLQIASAMSKPGVPVNLTVHREGVPEPLEFALMPQKDSVSGLLSIGVAPAKSTTLWKKDERNFLADTFESTGLGEAGVKPGMRLARVNGQNIQTYEQFESHVEQSEGEPILTEWVKDLPEGSDTQPAITATIETRPTFDILRYAVALPDNVPNFEVGLLGMSPLTRIREVAGGPNVEILKAGDVILRIGSIDGPRVADIFQEIANHADGDIDIVVLRGEEGLSLQAKVDNDGKLNVHLTPAFDLPMIARPMETIRRAGTKLGDESASLATPIAGAGLFPTTRIDAVNGSRINNWAELREQFRRHTNNAQQSGSESQVELTVTLPTPDATQEIAQLTLTPHDVKSIHALSWTTELTSVVFDPVQTTLTANGNPITAVSMGLRETHKMVMMTYLTIDRLVRGTVGVDQLRGPVGIVHIGSKVADRGLMYIIFFLGMISVNLAVINFLPMPIVDGGLFLFLVYEKFKGRPPSIAFQNAATILGLCLIGTIFIVTFYNDVLRLIS